MHNVSWECWEHKNCPLLLPDSGRKAPTSSNKPAIGKPLPTSAPPASLSAFDKKTTVLDSTRFCLVAPDLSHKQETNHAALISPRGARAFICTINGSGGPSVCDRQWRHCVLPGRVRAARKDMRWRQGVLHTLSPFLWSSSRHTSRRPFARGYLEGGSRPEKRKSFFIIRLPGTFAHAPVAL